MGRGLAFVVSFCFGLTLAVSAGFAQDAATTGKKLTDVERALQDKRREADVLRREAQALELDRRRLADFLVTAASKVQTLEADVTHLEDEIKRLDREAVERRADLANERKRFGGVLMGLTKLARFPPEALIVQPGDPDDTVRGAILLRAAVPRIEERARDLRTKIESLNFARHQIEQRQVELASTAESLSRQRTEVSELIGRKVKLSKEAALRSAKAAKEATVLAKKAKNLRGLLARLSQGATKKRDAARRAAAKAGAVGPMSKARGRLPLPVSGTIVGRYGEELESGLTHKGLSLETRKGGQVVAPYAGKVVFAGPFRGYGLLLIIDHGEGYHTLLAGMGRIDTKMSQTVVAGEPVGIMGKVSDKGAKLRGKVAGNPVLYVELRRNNQPINPLPWMVARKGKTNG